MEWWEIMVICGVVVTYPVWKLVLIAFFGSIVINIMSLIDKRKIEK